MEKTKFGIAFLIINTSIYHKEILARLIKAQNLFYKGLW